MLRPESHADDASRELPQPRMTIEQPQRQRQWLETDFPFERWFDDALVRLHLQRLRPFRRRHSSHLHDFERSIDQRIFTKAIGANIRGRDGILNRQIDADATDRRHRVRRIADAKQTRAPPFPQSIDAHRKQAHVIPVAQALRCDRAGTERRRRRRREISGCRVA